MRHFAKSFALIFLVAITVLVSCNREQKSLKFAYQPFSSNLPIFVAFENGYFEELGLKVEPVKIISANDAANAVVNNEVVANATVPLNVLLNIEEKQPDLMKIFMIKATSKDVWSDYILVKKGSEISSLSDLAGKTIGSYPGSNNRMLMQLILDQFIDNRNYTTVEMPPSTQLPGLDAGNVDALLTYDELAMTGLENGIAQVLVEKPLSTYVINPYNGFPYVISTKFMKENPEEAKKLIQAMFKAVDFINSNDEQARIILQKWTNCNEQIAQKVNLWDQVKLNDIDKDALQQLADFFFENGIIEKKIDTESLYVPIELIKK
jgi:NitT/TauT family transport system substrate-binding protein